MSFWKYCVINNRYFRTSCVLNAARSRNHYDSLGITPKATQADVKTAYYELSKVYHPDRNFGSQENAQKFRDITEAYEVLGNVRLRKLYDRGMYHGSAKPIVVRREEEEDDPTTRFYRSRERRHKVPHPSGDQPIYDFDEWTRQHYGSRFRQDRDMKNATRFHADMHREGVEAKVFEKTAITLSLVFIAFCYLVSLTDYDKVDTDKHQNRAPSQSAK